MAAFQLHSFFFLLLPQKASLFRLKQVLFLWYVWPMDAIQTLFHQLWSKLTSLRCNLELLQTEGLNHEFIAAEGAALISESLASVHSLIHDIQCLEKQSQEKNR